MAFENPTSFTFAHWSDYAALCKPRVVGLIVFTAVIGMFLSTPEGVDIFLLIAATVGIGLAATSAAALNHVIDSRADALMERTRNRPLPQGGLTRRHALFFAITMGVVAMYILIVFVNALTAALTFASLIGYAVIYTMYLKHATPQNIVIGGAAGALPPVIGWTIATGTISIEPIILFLIIFIWTPSHFWALSLYKSGDYKKAKIPMLPVISGVKTTKINILVYSLAMLPIVIAPYFFNFAGIFYLISTVLMTLYYNYLCLKLFKSNVTKTSNKIARKVFVYSIFYLFLIFLILLIDKIAGLY